jgi:NAD(P)H-hydrate repair Nnr-like enzyme with NAD(P)H-hydrate epimerase domain
MERTFRVRVQEAADTKVEEYVRSEEFSSMVEALKRRERERILAEVQREMETEKKRLIAEAKERMMRELSTLRQAETITVVCGSSDTGSDADLAEAILLQNTLKMEEQQRRAFLQKQDEDAKRLEQVLHNKRLEVN